MARQANSMKLTAKQHIAEAEKDAKNCAEHLRAALIKIKVMPKSILTDTGRQAIATALLLFPILETQTETRRKISQLLA